MEVENTFYQNLDENKSCYKQIAIFYKLSEYENI